MTFRESLIVAALPRSIEFVISSTEESLFRSGLARPGEQWQHAMARMSVVIADAVMSAAESRMTSAAVGAAEPGEKR